MENLETEIAEPEVEEQETPKLELDNKPVPELDNKQLQLAAEVAQKKMQGFSDEDIVQYFMNQYSMDETSARETYDMIMNYLTKKQTQDFQIKKDLIGVIPALAQSQNPLTPIMLQDLISKIGATEKEKSFAEELAEIQKGALKARLMADMMREMTTPGKSNYDPLMVELVKSLREDAKQKEEMLMNLLLQGLQGKDKEELAQFAEVVRQSIDALNQKIEAALMAQANSPSVSVEQKDTLDEMISFQEKLKKLQEAMKAMGFEVKPPGASEPDPLRQYEVQAKLKELELRQKEAEAKQAFYTKLAEALSNPQTLQVLFNGISQVLSGIFHKGAPTPETYQGAMMQAANIQPEPVKPPEGIPSIEEFLSEGEGNAEGQE